MLKFMHVGVPTIDVKKNEVYLDALKVFVTNPEEHELKFEYLRFEEDSPLPKIMQKNPHIAYLVDSIEETAKGGEIIVQPFDAGADTRIAFAVIDGVVFEFMENKQ